MTIDLTKSLIARKSVTPDDNGCLEIIAERLKKIGFELNFLPFRDVKNLWARRGNTGPLFAFVGHTDVVPTGPVEKWTFPPFEPTVHEGYLYGRGAQDMKSNIAAMITACERFIHENPNHAGSIALLLTSDEEGPSVNGTVKVVEYLKSQNIFIDYCIVGEPSSQHEVGDMLKIGRRGTLSAELIIHGKQGHIAYPHLADNPIHRALPCLAELIKVDWDNLDPADKPRDDNVEITRFFQPTSFQISNLHAGTGANNVIPSDLKLLCNFRYSTAVTAEILQNHFEKTLKNHQLNYTLQWHHSGKSFLTSKGKLLEACIEVIKTERDITPELSTNGGTSDGRFIAPMGTEVIELGVCNDRIHQIDERVKISELDILSNLYEKILRKLLLQVL